jgi:hypothetical protein
VEVVLVVVAQVVERSLDDGDMTHIIGIFWDSERDFIVIFWDFHGDFMELFLTNNMRGFFFVISNLFPRENSSPSGIELWLYPHGVTMAKHGGMKKTMVTGCSILGG